MDSYNNINNANPTQQQKDSKTKKIVAIILVIVIILLSCAIGFGIYLNKRKDADDEEALRKAVEEYTTKQLLEFYYDDYDADGKKEAFAIAGDGNKDDFKKADIIYVDRKKKLKTIDSDINGHTNGRIHDGKTKFISVEKETNQAEKSTETTTATQTTESAQTAQSRSYVYGVKEKEAYQPEISGKYQNVHQDGKNIAAEDPATGETLVLSVNNDGELVTDKADENKLSEDKTTTATTVPQKLTPTEKDWEQLASIISFSGDYDCKTATAKDVFEYKFCYFFYNVYDIFFFDEYFLPYEQRTKNHPYYDIKDPLNLFSTNKEIKDSLNFTSEGRVYTKENLDFLMKNVFNLSSSYSVKEDTLFKAEGEKCYYYYHDNSFYCFLPADYGPGEAPVYKLKDYTAEPDGKYKIVMSGMDEISQTSLSDLDITAELKEKNGMRYWSIYTIKGNGE